MTERSWVLTSTEETIFTKYSFEENQVAKRNTVILVAGIGVCAVIYTLNDKVDFMDGHLYIKL
jgi:hypothetical protein